MNMLSSAVALQVKPQLVLLHGWGFDRSVFAPWELALARYFQVRYMDLPGYGDCALQLDDWCIELAERLPQPVALLGWSLGGQLAIHFAHRYPAKVKALINLAGNPSFVQRSDWFSAMPTHAFEDFEQNFTQNPELALRRFTRLVAQGASYPRELQKLFKKQRAATSLPLVAQQQGLRFLRDWDVRRELSQLKIPVLHILGEHDQLVPNALVDKLRSLVPWQKVHSVKGAGHAIFLQNGVELAEKINQFTAVSSVDGITKKRVAESFSKAASSYDAVAHLQRRVGDRLLGTLDSEQRELVLDLGCGTGSSLPHLQIRFPMAAFVAVDIAHGMLEFARAQHSTIACTLLCADAEDLPLADESIDCMFSNLALQWCDLAVVLRECQRVLRPGGKLYVSTLGPETLRELRAAWSEVDDYVHVNRFTPIDDVHAAIASSGLHEDAVSREMITLQYPDLRSLTSELKALGAHNINSGAPRGLTGKQRLRALLEAYEQQRNTQGMLPASYEAFYMSATKPND